MILERSFRDEFQNLENEWAQAILSNNAEAIERFMSDDWVIVSETGVSERKDFIRLIETGALTHETMEGTVSQVRVYDNIAVVISRGTNKGKYKGEPFRSDEWIMDIFVKQDDRWRCLVTHLTPAKGK